MGSDFDDSLPLVHGSAAWALREIMIRGIFENVITDSANDEVFSPPVLSPFLKNLSGDPGKEDRAEDDGEKHGNHAVESDAEHDQSFVRIASHPMLDRVSGR